jgi:hypothetical protein
MNSGYLPTKTVSCENIPSISAASLQAALQKVKVTDDSNAVDQQEVFMANNQQQHQPNGHNNVLLPSSGSNSRFPYSFLRSRLTSLPEKTTTTSTASVLGGARVRPLRRQSDQSENAPNLHGFSDERRRWWIVTDEIAAELVDFVRLP